ncbi:MAG: hypothetical protein HOH98_02235, partial [Flavobacteriaceae bacterium]|nr:hypothetical protein [Flavobacteriaceae bacterium]
MKYDTIESYIISHKEDGFSMERSQLIKYFVSSLNKKLSLESKSKTIVNLPYINLSTKWIVLDMILNHMQKSYENTSIRFEPGDHLRIVGTRKKIICKFLEYVDEGTSDEMMRIKFAGKDNLSFLQPIDRWAFEKVEGGPLTSYRQFTVNEKFFAIDKITGKSSNNNFALFNTTFLYISRINSVKKFISNYRIFENPIQRTIEWSKTNEDGDIKRIHGHETGHINCIIAPSISSGIKTIFKNSDENFNAIIIDDIEFSKNSWDDIIEISDLDIPIFIFSKNLDKENYDIFYNNLDYQIWHWGMNSIKELLLNTDTEEKIPIEVNELKNAFSNFSNKKINVTICCNKDIQ